MANVTVQKRGSTYQYKFEIAKEGGKRKFISKAGYKTKAEAYKSEEIDMILERFKEIRS